MSKDPLADLGLDTVAPTTVAAKAKTDVKKSSKAGTKDVPVETTTTSHEEVEVGEIEIGFADFIPTAKRVAGGSKYPFDKLVAPAVDQKSGKTRYAQFTVELKAGVDADKLKRSVQSATTQANKQGKNEGKYFVSRSVTNEGEFVGMQVFRTDERSDD